MARRPSIRHIASRLAETPWNPTHASEAEEPRPEDLERCLRRLGAIAKTARSDGDAAEAVVTELAEEAGLQRLDVAARLSHAATAYCLDTPLCHECHLRPLCPHPDRGPTIKELPEDQRPRERLIASGPDALTEAELLAIIIRDGTTKDSAVGVAQKLLNRFGGLRGLSERRVKELCVADGVGPAKASQISAALALARRLSAEQLKKGISFRSSRQVYEHFFPRLRAERQERFICVLLDAKNRIIREAEISSGGLSGSPVHPRDIFRHAVVESASAVIFVHNHPSGDPTPSRDDIALTQRLARAGELMGVRVLDHVIVGEEGYTSLADEGKMK